MLYMSQDVAKLPVQELSARRAAARRATAARLLLGRQQLGQAAPVLPLPPLLPLRPERDAREHELPDDSHGGGQHGRSGDQHEEEEGQFPALYSSRLGLSLCGKGSASGLLSHQGAAPISG